MEKTITVFDNKLFFTSDELKLIKEIECDYVDNLNENADLVGRKEKTLFGEANRIQQIILHKDINTAYKCGMGYLSSAKSLFDSGCSIISGMIELFPSVDTWKINLFYFKIPIGTYISKALPYAAVVSKICGFVFLIFNFISSVFKFAFSLLSMDISTRKWEGFIEAEDDQQLVANKIAGHTPHSIEKLEADLDEQDTNFREQDIELLDTDQIKILESVKEKQSTFWSQRKVEVVHIEDTDLKDVSASDEDKDSEPTPQLYFIERLKDLDAAFKYAESIRERINSQGNSGQLNQDVLERETIWLKEFESQIERFSEEIKCLKEIEAKYRDSYMVHKSDNSSVLGGSLDGKLSFIGTVGKTINGTIKIVFGCFNKIPWYIFASVSSPVLLVVSVFNTYIHARELKQSIEILSLQDKIITHSLEEFEEMKKKDKMTVEDKTKLAFMIAMNTKHRVERNFLYLSVLDHTSELVFGAIGSVIGLAGTILEVITAANIVVFPAVWLIVRVLGKVSNVLEGIVSFGLIAARYGMTLYYKPNEFYNIVNLKISLYIHLVFAKLFSHTSDYFKQRVEQLTMEIHKTTFEDIRHNLSKDDIEFLAKLYGMGAEDVVNLINTELINTAATMTPEQPMGDLYRLMTTVDKKRLRAGSVCGANIYTMSEIGDYIKILGVLSSLMSTRKDYVKKFKVSCIT